MIYCENKLKTTNVFHINLSDTTRRLARFSSPMYPRSKEFAPVSSEQQFLTILLAKPSSISQSESIKWSRGEKQSGLVTEEYIFLKICLFVFLCILASEMYFF